MVWVKRGEGKNIAHQVKKKMNMDGVKHFRDRFNILLAMRK